MAQKRQVGQNRQKLKLTRLKKDVSLLDTSIFHQESTLTFAWGVRYFFWGLLLIVHDEYALNQIIGKSNTCLWSSFGSQGLAKSDALLRMYVGSIYLLFIIMQIKFSGYLCYTILYKTRYRAERMSR